METPRTPSTGGLRQEATCGSSCSTSRTAGRCSSTSKPRMPRRSTRSSLRGCPSSRRSSSTPDSQGLTILGAGASAPALSRSRGLDPERDGPIVVLDRDVRGTTPLGRRRRGFMGAPDSAVCAGAVAHRRRQGMVARASVIHRLAVSAGSAALLASMLVVVPAAPAVLADVGPQTVVGNGNAGGSSNPRTFDFVAVADEAGNADGTIRRAADGIDLAGTVTCLTVDGDDVIVGGRDDDTAG